MLGGVIPAGSPIDLPEATKIGFVGESESPDDGSQLYSKDREEQPNAYDIILECIVDLIDSGNVEDIISAIEILRLAPGVAIDGRIDVNSLQRYLQLQQTGRSDGRDNTLIETEEEGEICFASVGAQMDFIRLFTYGNHPDLSWSVVDYPSPQDSYENLGQFRTLIEGFFEELTWNDGVFKDDQFHREIVEDGINLRKFIYILDYYMEFFPDEYEVLIRQNGYFYQLVREATLNYGLLRMVEEKEGKPVRSIRSEQTSEGDLQYEWISEDSVELTYAYLLDLLSREKFGFQIPYFYYDFALDNPMFSLEEIFEKARSGQKLTNEEVEFIKVHILTSHILNPDNAYGNQSHLR